MRKNHVYRAKEEDENFRPSRSNTTDKLSYLLVGGGIGAIIALLFAPKAGHELRGDLVDVSRKGYDKTRERAQQLRGQSGDYYQQLRQTAGGLYNRSANVGGGLSVETKSEGINQDGSSLKSIKDDLSGATYLGDDSSKRTENNSI